MDLKKFVQVSIFVLILFAVVFSIGGYAVNQGFNPSDEGVVLSQSWRLLNGEIPHKEFISIRPVGSGLLHQLDLILPFPLIPTSRIIAAFEYILLSILWAFIVLSAAKDTITPGKKYLVYGAVIISTIVLNLNNGPVFTWTTTDALLLDTVGFYFIMRFFEPPHTTAHYYRFAIPALFFTACAALCRQSFALPFILTATTVLFYNFQWKKTGFRILICIAGSLPLLLYFFYLYLQGALQLFIDQMTGRTELVETGIFTYAKSLVKYPWMLLPGIGLLILFWKQYMHPSGKGFAYIANAYFPALICATAWFTFHLFLGNYSTAYSFYFFWLAAVLLLYGIFIWKLNKALLLSVLITLCIAWTSSISIGDNSPRPYLGGLAMSGWILLCMRLVQYRFIQRHLLKAYGLLAIAAILLFTVSQISMPKVNYRDHASSKLNYTLEDIFPEMGKTKVNETTRNYFVEFNRIYRLLNAPRDHFTMIPNNAFIYAVMHSRNPLPLDWMQHHEYIGAEAQFFHMVEMKMHSEEIFLFVDKTDSKLFYKGSVPFEPDLEFNHSYLPQLLSLGEKLPIESAYFEIYKSVNQNLGH